MTDRRSQPRYDVVGTLWGVLELREEAHIRNVSATGALVESSSPVALDSSHTVCLAIDGQEVAVETRVRHVQPFAHGRPDRYMIGLEFVSPPVSVLHTVEQLSSHPAPPGETEASR